VNVSNDGTVLVDDLFTIIVGGTDVALLMVVPEPNSWSMLIGRIFRDFRGKNH
jgi:hypothetical protein